MDRRTDGTRRLSDRATDPGAEPSTVRARHRSAREREHDGRSKPPSRGRNRGRTRESLERARCPGPAILYALLATAPQFASSGLWSAPPILVSGASSYRAGEYVYQDFLYDDHGANAPVPDPTDVRVANATFSRPAGSYTYRPIRGTRATRPTSSSSG